ncbi:MAG: O-antigen ligase family protein [Caldilineaceae bacterium]|nr:O-antigen ligase family protein [Caldilineaceae bacterium]
MKYRWGPAAAFMAVGAAALLATGLATAGHATTVVVLVAVGTVLAAALRWPDCRLSALVLTALHLPFAVLPVDFGLKPSLLNIAVGLVLVRWAVAGIRGELEPIHLFSVAPTLLFALLYTAAVFWGFNFETPSAFESRKTAEYLMGLMLFPVALTTLTTARRIRIVVTALAVGGTVAALAALFLYFVPRTAAADILGSLAVFDYPKGNEALRFINDNPLEAMRAIGLSTDPNLLGAVCVLTSAVLLPFFFRWQSPTVQIAACLALAVVAAATYLTYSRNALLAIGTIGLFLAVFRHRILLPAGGALALLLVLLPQTQGYVRRLAEGLMGRDLATRMRLTEYANALEIVREWPWTGIGFFGPPGVDLEMGVSMVYLAVASMMGVPALLLFCGILLAPLFQFQGTPWRGHPLEPWVLGLAGAVVGLVMTGLFDHFYVNLLYPHMSALYWLLLGTCTAALRLVRSDRGLAKTA